jgi:hypothetical protein
LTFCTDRTGSRGKVVDIPADDSTREWRAWNGTKSTVAAMEEAEDKHKIRQKVNLAMKYAAKDGGAALLLGVQDNPAGPLDLGGGAEGRLALCAHSTRAGTSRSGR